MNPELDHLQAYPFQRLAQLLGDAQANPELAHIALSIGEPKHAPPPFVYEVLTDNLAGLADYPKTIGSEDLRQAICEWLANRFDIPAASLQTDKHILPVNGTREALFAIAQAVINRQHNPLVLFPNPFYQIYEGATLLAGAEPGYLACDENNGFLPDLETVSPTQWKRCQMVYICSPGNPSGAVMDEPYLQKLIELAHQHDFIIASDECYSELYAEESQPPAGILGVAQRMGIEDFSHCLAFHSLSKRSNVPGLRSGFVAGDADVIKSFLLYRTYHGCAMPPPTQAVSASLWRDEQHVRENRIQYRQKFDAVLEILKPVLPVSRPAGGFYLWPKLPEDDQQFTRRLYEQKNITVLPGSYLSRTHEGSSPGAVHVRLALVAPLNECVEAANRIHDFLNQD